MSTIQRKSKSQAAPQESDRQKRNTALATVLDPIVSGAIPPRSQYMQQIKQFFSNQQLTPGQANEYLQIIQTCLAAEDLYERLTSPDQNSPQFTTVQQELRCISEKLSQIFPVFDRFDAMHQDNLRVIGRLGAQIRRGLQIQREGFLLNFIDDTDAVSCDNPRMWATEELSEVPGEVEGVVPKCPSLNV